jgi:alanine-synthesizing transaminase
VFSTRIPRSLAPNRITVAVQQARAGGRAIVDLTSTNPTTEGIEYPRDILAPLASCEAMRYAPTPSGLLDARRAVAAEYQRQGRDIDPDRIVLTASTSEAYSILFKLLCAPHGDAVLIPVPSYPLFDHLTQLDGVGVVRYRLEYHGRWVVAFDDLDQAWGDRVRAVLAVSPNNPTGSFLMQDELDGLASRCEERGAALIIDEVFADYSLAPAPAESDSAHGAIRQRAAPDCLTFYLGGLSKSAGLPQVKLGWIAVDGPPALVAEALQRLEIICDAYLSVSTPVQVAAPQLIASGAHVRAAIVERVQCNWRTLLSIARRHPAVEVLSADAGWSAVLRVPSTRSEEDLVLELLERDGVLVHPGFFFDFAHEAFLVLSLLPPPHVFEHGLCCVLERADA